MGNKEEKDATPHVSGQANSPLSRPPYALTTKATAEEIGANAQDGLTAAEASSRLSQYGRNELDDGPGVQLVKILIRQVANAIMLVLIMAMAVSFGIQSWIEGGVVAAVIVLNIVVGFFQEFNAGLPAMGLGFEVAAPDLVSRPPHPLKTGVFTWDVCLDMLVYGLWVATLCLTAFSIVLFGFGDGNLRSNCNNKYSAACNTVFRARATTFVCLTWFALFLAWEMVNMRRSFFRMQPKSKKYFTQWMHDIWRNQFLFWSIMAGCITIFPILYIPGLNHVVFRHEGISWEWGIVMFETMLFSAGVESWKWGKRIYFRRLETKGKGQGRRKSDFEGRVFGKFLEV